MVKKRFLTYVAALACAAAVTACGGQGGAAEETDPVQTEAASETAASGESEAAESESEAAENESEAAEGEAETAESEAMPVAEYNQKYLTVYFDAALEGDITKDSFNESLQKIAGEEAAAAEEDSYLSMVKAAVTTAEYEELALSYPEDKVQERLDVYGVDLEDSQYAQSLACALDVSLITEDEAEKAAAGEAMTADEANELLMAVADARGEARNYLGSSDDPDIYGKIDNAWESFVIFDDEALTDIGRQAVEQQITTGYGIKSDAYSANFLPELTLQYGHSDIKHAHQLIGLLNSEDIRANVQLEPKISIYQYLLDWGPIPEATPTYEVKQFGDLYLVYAVEYDMQLEFENEEELLRFDSVIEEFAKKYAENADAEGLIYGSWWQPLYSSVRSDLPSDRYHEIYDCVVRNGIYSIHPFCLAEDKDQVVEKLNALNPDYQAEPVARYCNTAFYNYLGGTDYQ